jgi:ribosomal-protein-alanine N-acetyltransferase
MLLEVRPSNETALRLYRKYGFRPIGRRRGYYRADSGREDAMVLALRLIPDERA